MTYAQLVADADDRSRPLVLSLAVNTVVFLFALATGPALRLVLDDAGRPAWQVAFPLLMLAQLATVVVTMVLWLRWFRALYASVEPVGRARFGGAWWFWAWVIPVVNLVIPMMMVNDVWRGAAPQGDREPLPWQVRAWWVCWVAADVNRLARIVLPDAAVAALLPPWLAFVSAASLVAAGVFAISTVRLLTERVQVLDESPWLTELPAAAQR